MAVLHTFEEIEKALIAFSTVGPTVAAQVLEDARIASSKGKDLNRAVYYTLAIVEWWKRRPASPPPSSKKKEKGEQSEWKGERSDKATYKEIKL